MSSARDEQPLPDLEAVGDAYRSAGFDDEPPAHVDAFIRAAAKRESKRKLNDYLPSLAMAATVTLALGLVLRLTLPGPDLLGPTDDFEAGEAAAPPVLESGEFQERRAVQEQVAPLEDNAAASAAIVPAPEDTTEPDAQERAVRLEEVVVQARDSAVDSEENATATSAPAAARTPGTEGVAASAIARMAAPVSVPCAAPERDDPALWLTCIAAQIDAGQLDAARAELEQFRLAFADYPVPANIAESLGP